MTTRQTSIDEDEFQAFVDGQLPPEQCRAVMAYLAADPDESARMSDYRSLNAGLHQLYDEVLYEPLPERLRVEHYRTRKSWRERLYGWANPGNGRLPARAAAAVAFLVAGALSGWGVSLEYAKPEVEPPASRFTRQAANAHVLYTPDSQRPVEFDADQENSLSWLSERLGGPVHAPNLGDLGFALVGGRLLPAAELPAAQLMYENPDAERITLYIRSHWQSPTLGGAPEGTVNFTGEGGVSMVYWINGPFAYALIGALDREQLFATAKIIQQQLATQAPAPAPEQAANEEKGAT